jgi:hypothetical protein
VVTGKAGAGAVVVDLEAQFFEKISVHDLLLWLGDAKVGILVCWSVGSLER